jgi:hypothetical protein
MPAKNAAPTNSFCQPIQFDGAGSPSALENCASVFQKYVIYLRASRTRSRGALRDRHGRWERDAMDALASPDE